MPNTGSTSEKSITQKSDVSALHFDISLEGM